MAATAASSIPTVALGGGELVVRRILHGLWQTSGGWGDAPPSKRVDALQALVNAGYTSIDLADHYGPAEDLIGLLRERQAAGSVGPFEALTKWVPRPAPYTRAQVEAAVGVSLRRMRTDKLDNLQLHWWDYSRMDWCLDALRHLDALRREGKVGELSLTNFDTAHLAQVVDAGIPVASNQVQFSMVDARPASRMAPYCAARGIHLLTYGTLCGGLLTDAFLGAPEPRSRSDLPTPSAAKYFYGTIRPWGGWALFQELLAAARAVADRHGAGVTIANVATRWVLDQPGVGGVILGLRAGLAEHAAENARTFALQLTPADRAQLGAVLARGNDLLRVIGDCGDEYRG